MKRYQIKLQWKRNADNYEILVFNYSANTIDEVIAFKNSEAERLVRQSDYNAEIVEIVEQPDKMESYVKNLAKVMNKCQRKK